MADETNETSTTEAPVKGASKSKKTPGEKRQAAAAKKTAAKSAKSAKSAAPKKQGVIAGIIAEISRPEGASALEIQKVLAKKFPERDAEGMLTTIRIQITRLPKRFGFEMKKSKDEKRGLVYKCPASVVKAYEKSAAGGSTKAE